jgi:hypothetical protein
MAKKQRPKLCIDRTIPYAHKQDAARAAIAENRDNAPIMPRRRPGVSAHPAKISIEVGKRWKNGRLLGIRFLDGTKLQKEKVKQYAVEWSRYANIRFDFAAGAGAEIRVSFEFDPGSSWSAVGTDCLERRYFPKDEPTMNYGWFDETTPDQEYRRVIVHEFGHALGAIHEHSVPTGGIKWNLPEVYKYFSGPPNNWSKADIDFNVIQKYSVSQLNGTSFDPDSIMLYSFPPQLILGPPSLLKTGTRENNKLSALDKRFIAQFYPKKKPSGARVVRLTGRTYDDFAIAASA